MQIAHVNTACYELALPKPLSDSTHGLIKTFQIITIRLQDSEGLEGVGYTYTVGKGGVAVRELIRCDLVDFLIGRDPREIEELWDAMWWHLHYIGRGGIASFAMSAVDIALWDVNAKRNDQPLWKFLGGTNPAVDAYAGGIDLQFPLEQLLDQTQRNLDAGFRAIKMKVGRDRLEEDVERIAAMRKHLGPEIPLMVDANMRWSVEQAIAAAKAFREYDIYWLEEPTIPDDYDGHRTIAEQGCLPIATGENLHTIYEFEHMIAAKGVAFPEPDVSNIGGVTKWMQVGKLADSNGLPVTSHGVHDLHVHLLAASPNASYLEVHGFGLERFIKDPLAITDGKATAPDRPGHGVEFDWDQLEEFRK